jgi:hypothetical protein
MDGMGWRVNEATWSTKVLSSHPRDAHRDAMQCNVMQSVGIHMLTKIHFNIGSMYESQIGCLQLTWPRTARQESRSLGTEYLR